MVKKGIPEITLNDIERYRRILIIAPHQDDETLGCGGLIQRFVQQKSDVSVAFLTDGSMSHPNSSSHSATERANIRNTEAMNALKVLGVPPDKLYFLNATDSALPDSGENEYRFFLKKLRSIVEMERPQLMVCPCQFDPHRDHRAAWSMANDIASQGHPVLWEYPIWIYELGSTADLAAQQQKDCCYLRLSREEQQVKLYALKCHQSQIEPQIFNDPDGFLLTSKVIAHFSNHKEFFFTDRRYG